MKRVLILCAFLVAFAASSFAQTDIQAAPTTSQKIEKRKGRGNKQAANMGKELNLTSEQKTQLKNINGTYKGKMQALKTDNALSKDQKRAHKSDIQKAHDAELKGVLNTEQYAKFSQAKQQREKRGMGKMGKKRRSR
jgi:periplasmic protein CpxP/Spy